MKKLTALTISMAVAASAMAQEATPVMHINLKGGATIDYTLSEIETITFEEVTAAPLPAEFAVPTDFSASYVQKIMAGGKQVAEVAKEYVKDLGQVVVVYPCDENGKAILTKGMTTTGATVSWASNKPTVGEAAGDIAKFYVVDGELASSYDGETQTATAVADVLVDRRGTETQTYRIVKIGEQYWMADNLRATKWNDGTAIDGFAVTQGDDWSANTTGCYLVDTESDWVAIAGLLYNGYCAVSDKIAPEGWHVPTCDDYGKIKTSVGKATASLYRDDTPMAWSDGTACTNETGFSIVATGYYVNAGDLNVNAQFSETQIWTKDSSIDFLTRKKALDFLWVRASSASVVFPTKGLSPHDYAFGHCIRLVRD
ncbi:MAG: fibrobacter succinogenes major paralogous domain-containing protein [Clostridium sp.]|nr:fibrobacter succinogenes major paralogous domain-containing protein [Clostridium sp.]